MNLARASPPIRRAAWTLARVLSPVCVCACAQVKSGTIFDDIIVTDSIEEANAFAKETFYKKKDAEKEMFEKVRASVLPCRHRCVCVCVCVCVCHLVMEG
jgi:hypothetical protein